ncbi:TIGR01777 family oxidoreductase [Paraliomyxa miuraensis]|uniref:TIGR01777 family oxidoreductase n=1 Tax=Paraliomyxa miuraensis TaxID=376150 RepID=UPI002255E2B9|nr:TIGR01777 family oxidoreductase [Paraliomyxa miuraensis]MCX4242189.1 TIGR01777 family oxidoreductase [Paraliomyxa miuraensis]
MTDAETGADTGAEQATIAITGASGLVGTALRETLEGSGAPLRVLAVSRSRGPDTVVWSPRRGELDAAALRGVDAVVNLAGERIGPGRWTEERKRRIRESRIEGTRLLVKAFAELPRPPKVLVQASAVGYYGDTGDRWVDEESPRGEGFLASVVEDWEAASTPAEAMGVRVVRLRFGHVLGKGGLLDAMRTPTKLGLGGRLGSGRQFWSFIGIVDLVSIILLALEDADLRGVVNAVAPEPVRNAEFTERFAKVLHRPAWLPAPELGLRLLFGKQQAQEMLLWGQRVRPGVLLERGFEYAWPTLDDALSAVEGDRIALPLARAAALKVA